MKCQEISMGPSICTTHCRSLGQTSHQNLQHGLYFPSAPTAGAMELMTIVAAVKEADIAPQVQIWGPISWARLKECVTFNKIVNSFVPKLKRRKEECVTQPLCKLGIANRLQL
jgi:hypothetical protein